MEQLSFRVNWLTKSILKLNKGTRNTLIIEMSWPKEIVPTYDTSAVEPFESLTRLITFCVFVFSSKHLLNTMRAIALVSIIHEFEEIEQQIDVPATFTIDYGLTL